MILNIKKKFIGEDFDYETIKRRFGQNLIESDTTR